MMQASVLSEICAMAAEPLEVRRLAEEAPAAGLLSPDLLCHRRFHASAEREKLEMVEVDWLKRGQVPR